MAKACLHFIGILLIAAVLISGCNSNPVEAPAPISNETPAEQQTPKEPEKLEPQLITLDPKDYGNAALVNDRWEFTTVPEGAYVYLNGKRVGRTPFVMEQLPPAGTVLSVIKEGYRWYHQQLGREKPGYSSLNLIAGNWASQEEIQQAISEIKLQPAQVQEGQWQLQLGHMQLEQFSPSPGGESAVFFIERRIPEDAAPSKTDTFIKMTALLRFSPEMKLQVLEYRPIYVGQDMFFTKVLGWLDNDRLLYLEDSPEPKGEDPYYHGKALQTLNVVTGEKQLLHWLPPSIVIGYNSWLSSDKDVLYFATSGGYYRGAIGSIRLDTGEYRLIKNDLELYRPFEDLFLEKSASGERVVHLLNYRKDRTMPIFDLLTGGAVDLTPPGVAVLRPSWSPAGSLIAMKVGEPDQPYQVLGLGEGLYLESGDIWVVNDGGERISRINIPGKNLGNPLWLPDGKNLVFQIEKRTELSPEEAGSLPDDWKLAWQEIYRSDLEGNVIKLSLPEDEDYRLESVLNEEWLLAVNYPQGRPNYVLVSTSGKEAVQLPAGTCQVLGMAGERVVTCDDQKRIWIGYPGQELKHLATLEDLLSYHWFVNSQWLVLVDTGSHADEPSSLRIIKL